MACFLLGKFSPDDFDVVWSVEQKADTPAFRCYHGDFDYVVTVLDGIVSN